MVWQCTWAMRITTKSFSVCKGCGVPVFARMSARNRRRIKECMSRCVECTKRLWKNAPPAKKRRESEELMKINDATVAGWRRDEAEAGCGRIRQSNKEMGGK